MDSAPVYILGTLTSGVLLFLAIRFLNNQLSGNTHSKPKKRLYGSEHGKLNLQLPPQSMWMNMGFWKTTEDFPTACCALLEEVLKTAQVLQDDEPGTNKFGLKTLSIIDLGFGCGDQCLYIKNVLRKQNNDKRGRSLKAYVGITLDDQQFCIAQGRLDFKEPNTEELLRIYCADAGRPESWPLELRNDISVACNFNREGRDHENWLLGLDALIHFQPSRWPVINYASRTLDASLMAYDLCVAENNSLWQRIVLRLVAIFGQSPLANWVTIQEYQDLLVAAGYARDKIEIHDVSEHVFGPLAGFLGRREEELKRYGLSIGRFRYAATMFRWWAKTGLVRGCIIVARK